MKPLASVPGRAPAVGASDVDVAGLAAVALLVGGGGADDSVSFCPDASHSTRPSNPAKTPNVAPMSSHWPAPEIPSCGRALRRRWRRGRELARHHRRPTGLIAVGADTWSSRTRPGVAAT